MYQLVVTENFINIIKSVPLRHISAMLRSVVSVKKLEGEKVECDVDNTFVSELLNQIGSDD